MRHMQNSWAMGVILENMGRLARRQGDLAQAKRHLRESLRLRGQHGDRSGLAKTLLDLAIVLHAEDEPFLAAQLLAASTTFQESVGVPLSSIEQSEYERVQTDLRAILDAEAFARQWDAGAGLSAEQVDALLSETD